MGEGVKIHNLTISLENVSIPINDYFEPTKSSSTHCFTNYSFLV